MSRVSQFPEASHLIRLGLTNPNLFRLSDKQWAAIEPHLPQKKGRGRPRQYPLREIVNGIIFRLRTRCTWRDLPPEFPPWELVYGYFNSWCHQRNSFELRKLLSTTQPAPEPNGLLAGVNQLTTSQQLTAPQEVTA